MGFLRISDGLIVNIVLKQHECFEDQSIIPHLKPINIIIGRNNSGKSKLINVIEKLVDSKFLSGNLIKCVECKLCHEKIDAILKNNFTKGNDEYTYAFEYLDNLAIKYTPQINSHNSSIQNYSKKISSPQPTPSFADYVTTKANCKFSRLHEIQNVCTRIEMDLKTNDQIIKGFGDKLCYVFKISAERDIVQEELVDIDKSLLNQSREKLNYEGILSSNGVGVTNILSKYIHTQGYNRNLVYKNILDDMNKIFSPDIYFTEIITKHHEDTKKWEIFLGEEKKGLIPLSASGSGIKTVIQVLVNLLILPDLLKKLGRTISLEKVIFAFEELENNLHPALQKKLFKYIEDFAKNNKCMFLVTTHAAATIDYLGNSDLAQIISIEHDGNRAKIYPINDYAGKHYILDQLVQCKT